MPVCSYMILHHTTEKRKHSSIRGIVDTGCLFVVDEVIEFRV